MRNSSKLKFIRKSQGLKKFKLISTLNLTLLISPTYAEESSVQAACEVASLSIQNIQNKIFEMKVPNGEQTYLDLLKQRDALSGKKVMIETLLNLWDQYYNYLGENENYKNTPEEVKNSVSGLMDLRNLIANNEQSVQKYQLLTDVFNTINPEELVGKDAQENFNILKASLQEKCSSGNNHLMYCQIANNAAGDGIDLWQVIQPGAPITPETSSRQAMLQKFLDVSSDAVGYENLGWFKNLSSMYVDNEELRYDLVGNGNLSQSVVSTLDQVVAKCREQALLSNGRVNCMSSDLKEILDDGESSPQLSQIQSYLGSEVKSAQDLVDKYLQNVNLVSHAHEEIAGGTIDKFKELAQRRAEITANLTTADLKITQNAEAAKDSISKAAAIEVAKMAKHFKVLKNSDQLYRNYKNDPHSPIQDLATMANTELDKVMRMFPGFSGGNVQLFFNAPDHNSSEANATTIGIRPDAIFDFFKNSNLTKDRLAQLLSESLGENGTLDEQIAKIDQNLAYFKNNSEYNLLDGLKTFAWKDATDKCNGISLLKTTQESNSQCVAENYSEVDNLLKVGNKIVSYQNNFENEATLNEIYDNCEKTKSSYPELYAKNYSSICNEVYQKRREVAKIEEHYSAPRVRERLRTTTYYDDEGEKALYTYKSKSWAQILPGALSMAMPAGLQLGKTWSNTPAIRAQMLGATTFAKQRYRYMEQQYYQGVNYCNSTMTCYYNSQYQSFLPTYSYGSLGTFGTSVTNGTNLFTNNSTILSQ